MVLKKAVVNLALASQLTITYYWAASYGVW